MLIRQAADMDERHTSGFRFPQQAHSQPEQPVSSRRGRTKRRASRRVTAEKIVLRRRKKRSVLFKRQVDDLDAVIPRKRDQVRHQNEAVSKLPKRLHQNNHAVSIARCRAARELL